MASWTSWTVALLALVLSHGPLAISGTFGLLPNVSEAVHDIKVSIAPILGCQFVTGY